MKIKTQEYNEIAAILDNIGQLQSPNPTGTQTDVETPPDTEGTIVPGTYEALGTEETPSPSTPPSKKQVTEDIRSIVASAAASHRRQQNSSTSLRTPSTTLRSNGNNPIAKDLPRPPSFDIPDYDRKDNATNETIPSGSSSTIDTRKNRVNGASVPVSPLSPPYRVDPTLKTDTPTK